MTASITNRFTGLAGVAAVLAALAGCGSDDESTTTNSAKPAAAETTAQSGAPPSTLAGRYERRVTKADIDRTEAKRQEGPGQERPKPARTRMTIDKAGITVTEVSTGFTIGLDAQATGGGALSILGYTDPGKGAFCGPEVAQNASYVWSTEDETVTLKAKDDPCADRDSVMSGTWRRVG